MSGLAAWAALAGSVTGAGLVGRQSAAALIGRAATAALYEELQLYPKRKALRLRHLNRLASPPSGRC
jgi:hypothetical protein